MWNPHTATPLDVAQRVPVIRRPLALGHAVPRGLVRIHDEGQEDVRMLPGHELVKRVRDDVFRAAAREDEDDAIPTPSIEPTGLTLATREPWLFLFALFERRFRSKWNISGWSWRSARRVLKSATRAKLLGLIAIDLAFVFQSSSS